MLIVVSPAKTLDMQAQKNPLPVSTPVFLDESQILIDTLKKLSAPQLSQLMAISDDLAQLNVQRNHDWHIPFTTTNAKPALFAFRGDVYEGLDADSLTADDIAFAENHLRILSGLYGLLKPLDLMQAYRLEMGTRLHNVRGSNLYQFWGNRVTDAVNDALQASGAPALINLASNEYFKVLQPKRVAARIVTPQFLDRKNGQYKIISFYAKRARGLMASWIIRQRITDPEQLKAFTVEGYRFDAERSVGDDWAFLREERREELREEPHAAA